MSARNSIAIRSRILGRRVKRKAKGFYDRHKANPVYLSVLLGGFCLACALILASGHMATEAAIQQRQKEDLLGSLSKVIPESLHDNDLVRDVFTVTDKQDGPVEIYPAYEDGKVKAVAYRAIGLGYGGAIQMLVGVDNEGKLLGVRVLQHAETPGLGDKIEENRSDWIHQFDGTSLMDPGVDQWKVKKDGGHFDQLSGATITPRAVVLSVRKALELFDRHRDEMLGQKEGSQS